MTKPRARDLGLPFPGVTGPLNAITDVPGVQVGFCTLTDPARKMRTGVTAILPRPGREPRPVWAGHYALNGNGEMTGTHWVDDAGHFIGPILITNTHGVGAAHTGATRWMIDTYGDWFRDNHAWAMPIVAETYDGVLNDINAMHVQPGHAMAALAALSAGPVAEGSTGGGNGMISYEFKGGTGTASRRVGIGGADYTVAALVQANHGLRPWLSVLGTGRADDAGRRALFRRDGVDHRDPCHRCTLVGSVVAADGKARGDWHRAGRHAGGGTIRATSSLPFPLRTRGPCRRWTGRCWRRWS